MLKIKTSEPNINLFEKQFCKNIVDVKNTSIEVISTNSKLLDQALECQGIPRGRITEIYGSESSGKTTLCLEIVKANQAQNQKTLFIDVEGSTNVDYLKKLNINLDLITIVQPLSGEMVFSMIECALKNDSFDLIIVDSVAAMISSSEHETNIEENSVLGTHARMMSRGLRRVQNLLYDSKTAIIFINQLREKIGVFFGNPETTTGGRALRFFSTIRMEIKKVDLIKNSQDKIGIKSRVTVTKNKLGKPFNSAFINIYFNEGYNYTKDMVEYAVEKEIITKNGSWYYLNSEKLAQGLNNLIDYYNKEPEKFKELESLINEKL